MQIMRDEESTPPTQRPGPSSCVIVSFGSLLSNEISDML